MTNIPASPHHYQPPSPEYTETHLSKLFAEEEAGYHRGLKNRQIQMIAIGGAIGTGLFMGAGGRLHQAGPSLVLIYAISGSFGFLMLRAMGELVLHTVPRPDLSSPTLASSTVRRPRSPRAGCIG